jgi:hypothetical protein
MGGDSICTGRTVVEQRKEQLSRSGSFVEGADASFVIPDLIRNLVVSKVN